MFDPLYLSTYIFHVILLHNMTLFHRKWQSQWHGNSGNCLLSGSVGEKFPSQTGSLEFFTALPDKIFCLGFSSHSWPSGKFVYARYACYTNSNALLWLRLSSIDVFCPHFVRAKNRPSGLERLSSPRQILFRSSFVLSRTN